MLRRLAVMGGWGGAAFAVQTAFAMASFDRPDMFVVATYAVALATTFALHRATRGPVMLGVAFGLGWALFVEGVAVLVAAEGMPLSKRGLFAIPLALPLAALVVRRFSTDPEDAWFRQHVRRVLPPSLVVALSLLVAGAIGSWRADQTPYLEARAILGFGPCGGDFGNFLAWSAGLRDETESPSCRSKRERLWVTFLAESSGVEPSVRSEVDRACGRFGASDPFRASDCADKLLVERLLAATKRREDFRKLGFASLLPFGIAFLFAWRGRRVREKSS